MSNSPHKMALKYLPAWFPWAIVYTLGGEAMFVLAATLISFLTGYAAPLVIRSI